MDNIYKDNKPSIAVVIGTYASIPYVHLQLEVWKSFCNNVPLLVHDDFSHHRYILKDLCKNYGVDLITTSKRMGHVPGDVAAFLSGFEWAQEKKCDLLVKMSRRFVPLRPWQNELEELAFETQFPTFSSICLFKEWGFRSECFAVNIPLWGERNGCTPLKNLHLFENLKVIGTGYFAAEAIYCKAATDVYQKGLCEQAEKHDEGRGYFEGAPFAYWDLIGSNRLRKYDSHLWYESHTAEDYADYAVSLGLDYKKKDFEDDLHF